jgi:transposase-like protein
MDLQVTQFATIIELLQAFPNEQSCIDHLEGLRWNGNVISPFDETSKVYKCAGNKYKCKNTGKYFNVRTATIFEDTKVPLQKWFMALYVFSSHKKGISSHQLAKDIGITQKSAWFLLHRLRYAFSHPAYQKEVLDGIVEVDETFVGGKNKNRHHDKKFKYYKGGGRDQADKVPVFGMMQRNGNVIAKVVPNTEKQTLIPIIQEHVSKGSVIVSDDYSSYVALREDYTHKAVKHLPAGGKRRDGERYFITDDGIHHTQNIENFWSIFKRGIFGVYHHVTAKHLQRYCDEFTARRNTRDIGVAERFNTILTQCQGRLKYKDLIYNKTKYDYFEYPI